MSTTDVLLAQLVDSIGELQKAMGGVQARLDNGDVLRVEIKRTLEELAPIVMKVSSWETHIGSWETHITKALLVHQEFELMKLEFENMKIVTGRFTAVALLGGTVVGAALWALGTVWPFVWGVLKLWASQHIRLG